MDVEYIYAICGHCEAAVQYYVEKFDQPRAREEAIYEQ